MCGLQNYYYQEFVLELSCVLECHNEDVFITFATILDL